tara:strand:- start:484 stop:588 length:105 start_codon:yes stop_codon:yes gene_type:complete
MLAITNTFTVFAADKKIQKERDYTFCPGFISEPI